MILPKPLDWSRGQPGIVAYLCQACGYSFYFERGFCPSCGGRDITPIQSVGTGTVLARTLVHRAPSEALRTYLPYALILVRLTEGFVVMGHGDSDLGIGDGVRASFVAFGEAAFVPFFLPQEGKP